MVPMVPSGGELSKDRVANFSSELYVNNITVMCAGLREINEGSALGIIMTRMASRVQAPSHAGGAAVAAPGVG